MSGKTSHLLAGDGAGGKLAKARSLGVEVVGEEELDALVIEKGGEGLWPR